MLFLLTTFIIPWSDTMTTNLLSDISGVISDLSPLLVVLIAVGVGLIIFHAILTAIRGH